jgi:spore maturation protein CgeB
MKILVTFLPFMNYGQSIVNSLRQLGHDVIAVNMIYFSDQCNYIERKLYKIGATFLETNYRKTWNKNFIDVCDKFQPEIVLTLNFKLFEHTTLHKLKKCGTKLILWMTDSIQRSFIKDYDYEGKLGYFDNIYCFEEQDLGYLKDRYGLNSYYCPMGYDEDIYFPDSKTTQDIDISFVGSVSKQRSEILQVVAKYAKQNSLNMQVFGKWWTKKYFWKEIKFARQYSPLNNYYYNGIAPLETAKIHKRSKICLNIHIPVHTGLNPRTFEILGTGSFELMDARKNISGLIRPDTDLVMYKDIDELLNKIEYYLSNDKERQKIANTGYEWVKERYTIKQMAKNIVNCV